MTEGAALSAYVAGKISFNAFRNAVANSTEFVFEPRGSVRILSRVPLPRTVVHPMDVERALRRYHNGELTAEELSVWGLVLYNLDAFEVQAPNEPAEEETWDVIGQLPLASVNDAFNAARVSELLARLHKLTQAAG
jgi:hypothetical protein